MYQQVHHQHPRSQPEQENDRVLVVTPVAKELVGWIAFSAAV
jgi:hypothetical protein